MNTVGTGCNLMRKTSFRGLHFYSILNDTARTDIVRDFKLCAAHFNLKFQYNNRWRNIISYINELLIMHAL